MCMVVSLNTYMGFFVYLCVYMFLFCLSIIMHSKQGDDTV